MKQLEPEYVALVDNVREETAKLKREEFDPSPFELTVCKTYENIRRFTKIPLAPGTSHDRTYMEREGASDEERISCRGHPITIVTLSYPDPAVLVGYCSIFHDFYGRGIDMLHNIYVGRDFSIAQGFHRKVNHKPWYDAETRELLKTVRKEKYIRQRKIRIGFSDILLEETIRTHKEVPGRKALRADLLIPALVLFYKHGFRSVNGSLTELRI